MGIVLLDIDGVLINWDNPAHEAKTGFSDWTKIHQQYFDRVSYNQLHLIDSLFGESIKWLTTWEQNLQNPMANSYFCKYTNWPHRESAVAAAGKLIEQSAGYYWWKAGVVHQLLEADHHYTHGKVLWVDDDLSYYQGDLLLLEERFGINNDTFRLTAPWPAWSEKQIREDYEWLMSE